MAEAVDALITLGWALAAWIVILSAIATIALFIGCAAVTWAARVACGALGAAVAAAQACRALQDHSAPEKPADGHTPPVRPPQSLTEEDAA